MKLDPLNGKNPQLSYLHIKSINHLGREKKKKSILWGTTLINNLIRSLLAWLEYCRYRTENVPSLGGSVGLWVVSGAT